MRPRALVLGLLPLLGAVAAAQPVVVWDRTWEAGRHDEWQHVPLDGWPKNRGQLLVRVAFAPGVHTATQRVSGSQIPTNATDYLVDSDVIEEKAQQNHAAPSWSWAARGHGRIRVQVLWFSSKRDARSWGEDHPYDAEFAPTVLATPANPFEGRVVPLWEHAGPATHPPQWFEGPHRNWNVQRGQLLLRIAGGPQVRGLLWRVGPHGQPTELPAGDHLLDPRVLERTANSPFEVLLGGGGAPAEPFHFAYVGQGPARLQLLWVAHRDLAPQWTSANPFGIPIAEPGGPGIPSNPAAEPPPPPVPVPLPEPAGPGNLGPGDARPDPRSAPGFIHARFTGRLRDARGEPLEDVDVVVQLRERPYTIYGGGRTDQQGRFAFGISVPAFTDLVIRAPGVRIESPPRRFDAPDQHFEWLVRLR